MKLKPFCLFGGLVFSATTMAQADRSQLDACYAISSNNERLACYDALARPPAAEPPVTAATTVPARTEPAVATDEGFGHRQSRVERDAEGAVALVDTIAAIEEVEPRKVQITLGNGQVWRQTIGKTFLLRKNDTVRITQSSWGSSFRLEKEGKPGYIQVLRLR